MNNLFTIDRHLVQRIACAMIAALLVVATAPMLLPHASADQFANRSIQLSDASPSGGSVTSGPGSGAGVTYRVSFTPANNAGSMVIDFCDNDPIIGDTCDTATSLGAMNASAATLSNVSGTAGGTGWTITATATQIKIKDDTSAHDIVGSTPQVFDLTGITNPAVTGTFYARMYTFSGNSWGTYASAASPGSFVDYGGAALSINALITITARVQESLTFCLSKADPSANWNTTHFCDDPNVVGNSGANLPALTLGHAVGGGTPVLDTQTVDTATMYSQLSTNATHGAIISLRNSNVNCGGLSADNGTTCAIPAAGATPTAFTAGVAKFGLYVANGVIDDATNPTSPGTGSITASTHYNDGTATHYGMDITTATAANGAAGGSVPATYNGSVIGTFGSVLAYTNAPCYKISNAYTFAATPSLTTPAGIYKSNMSMIATGTF